MLRVLKRSTFSGNSNYYNYTYYFNVLSSIIMWFKYVVCFQQVLHETANHRCCAGALYVNGMILLV